MTMMRNLFSDFSTFTSFLPGEMQRRRRARAPVGGQRGDDRARKIARENEHRDL